MLQSYAGGRGYGGLSLIQQQMVYANELRRKREQQIAAQKIEETVNLIQVSALNSADKSALTSMLRYENEKPEWVLELMQSIIKDFPWYGKS